MYSAACWRWGGLGHLGGTIAGYAPGTEEFVWSLSASGFVFLIVFLHTLRITRGNDRSVTVVSAVATVAWIGLALAFGAAVGDVADVRVLVHAGLSLALLLTMLAGLRRASTLSRAQEALRG